MGTLASEDGVKYAVFMINENEFLKKKSLHNSTQKQQNKTF